MENKKCYMVSTNDIFLTGCGTNMANVLGIGFSINKKKSIIPLNIYLPLIQKSEEIGEYTEVISGTTYYRQDDKLVSEDSLVIIDAICEGNLDEINFLCQNYSLVSLSRGMKKAYLCNKKIIEEQKVLAK